VRIDDESPLPEKPTSVRPPSRAICTARLDGADTDARIGTPATALLHDLESSAAAHKEPAVR